MAKTAVAIEDMRSVEPAGYIRAVGLRPEDSYGFLPLDLHDSTSYFFFYRDRPEYEERRTALPGAESVKDFGMFEVYPTGNASGSQDMSKLPESMQSGLGDLIASAQQAQQAWGEAGVAGGPNESEADRIARIDNLKEIGAITAAEHKDLIAEVKGGDAGPTPGGADAAPAAKDAPDLVVARLYPGLRSRSSLSQLNKFLPNYVERLGLCPEDVYGVYPRSTRESSTAESTNTEWDDFWIVYRDRPEYAAGREEWAGEMNRKGKWPAPEIYPGVAEPGSSVYDRPKIKVEKDRWPRAKMVMKKKGTDLGDALRKKIGVWGYEPEDSYGFCPDYDGGSIYFGWRKS